MSAPPLIRPLADDQSLASQGGRGARWPMIAVWGWVFSLGLLFIVLYRNFLWRMVRIATGEWGGDWSHVLIVPLISCYFIFQNSHRLASVPRRPYWPGLAVLFIGLMGFVWCIYPVRNDMLQGYSMIVSLFGLVLFLAGPEMMRVLWFPILYLSLGVKIADRYWELIAWQLQLIAAKSAALVMQFLMVDASVQGSTIELTFKRAGQWVVEPINVAEACSGLRMLMAFIALGAAVAYLVERAWWKRIVMLILAVPIAVTVNIGRVTVVGLLSMVDRDLSSGDFHVFVGMLMLIPAAGLFMLVGWILDRSVIDETRSSGSSGTRLPLEQPSEMIGWKLAPTVKGILVGLFLTVMMGMEYTLLLASYRPEDLFGGKLSGLMAWFLCFVGLVILVGGLWQVRSMLTKRTTSGTVSFGIAFGILLAAVLGLNGVVQATRTVLMKQSVPVRYGFGQIPKQVGTWVMESEEKRLSDESVESLGTRQYVSRLYRDESIQNKSSESFLQLHLAYYTGTPDTVPHVPDRCFVAGGARGISVDRVTVVLSGPAYFQDARGRMATSKLGRKTVRVPATDFSATRFTYADPARPERISNVIYFFVANGKFLPTPERVRTTAFDPRDRYSYYCKVEVRLFDVADPVLAAERSSTFLSAMMPEILACLPDWVDVTEGRWPTDGDELPK